MTLVCVQKRYVQVMFVQAPLLANTAYPEQAAEDMAGYTGSLGHELAIAVSCCTVSWGLVIDWASANNMVSYRIIQDSSPSIAKALQASDHERWHCRSSVSHCAASVMLNGTYGRSLLLA